MDFNYEQALSYILQISSERNISQAKLCEGICDSSNFSKICSKKRKLTGDLVLRLALKLNISLDDLKLYASFNDPTTYIKLMKQFKLLRENEDFHGIKELYNANYEQSQYYPPAYEQLLLWMKAISEHYINLNPLYAINLCEKAVNLTQPQFSFKKLNLEILNEIELDIFYELIYAYLGHEELTKEVSEYQFDYPITLCLAIINELENRQLLKDLKLFPRYCALLSVIYGVLENKEQLYLLVTKGIQYCQQNLEFSQIPTLYIGLIMYERLCQRPQKAVQYFYETLYLYRLQNKPPAFYKNLSHFIRTQQLDVDYKKVNQLLPKPMLTNTVAL